MKLQYHWPCPGVLIELRNLQKEGWSVRRLSSSFERSNFFPKRTCAFEMCRHTATKVIVKNLPCRKPYDARKCANWWEEIIVDGPGVSAMANQTANYYEDIYQLNHTVSTDDRDLELEYYLPDWTDLVLAGLFTMLIIVTIVSNN